MTPTQLSVTQEQYESGSSHTALVVPATTSW
jgi:hypothetical protein